MVYVGKFLWLGIIPFITGKRSTELTPAIADFTLSCFGLYLPLTHSNKLEIEISSDWKRTCILFLWGENVIQHMLGLLLLVSFSSAADVWVVLLCWGRGFVGSLGLLGSSPATAVEKGSVIRESSCSHFWLYIILAMIYQGRACLPCNWISWNPLSSLTLCCY